MTNPHMLPATQLTAVTEKLHGWAALQTEWKIFFNSYVLTTAAGVLLIDPTKPAPLVLEALDNLGEVTGIVLTNANHDREAGWFRKHYEAQIYAHEKAPADCDTKIDVLVVDGEKLPGGLTVIHLPGVTSGEMALFSQDDGGTLMIGDAIVHTAGKGLEMLPEEFLDNRRMARQSLHKLLNHNFQTATFSHGEAITPHADQKIAAFLRSHH